MSRPGVRFFPTDPGFIVPGDPQIMQGQEYTPEEMQKIDGCQAVRRMRHNLLMGVKGVMTVIRVLPKISTTW